LNTYSALKTVAIKSQFIIDPQ